MVYCGCNFGNSAKTSTHQVGNRIEANFYAGNFEKTKLSIETLAATTKKIGELKGVVEDPAFKRELFAVTEFRDLPG